MTLILLGFGKLFYLRIIDEIYKVPSEQLEGVETLILGDSHAMCAFNPALIPNSVNFSLDSEILFYTYCKLKVILHADNTLKNVIISVSYHNIAKKAEDYIQKRFIIDRYYPILNKQETTKLDLFGQCLGNIKFKKGFQLWGNNIFLQYLFKNGKVPYLGKYYGSDVSSLDEAVINKTIKRHFGNDGDKISTLNTGFLYKISELCHEYNLNVIYITTPLNSMYLKQVPESTIKELELLMEDIDRLFGDQYINLADMELEDDMYGDLDHVNSQGAAVLSNIVNRELCN